ncbi:hypothetical protein NL676_008492 [Syzygium grande]|nr:hypothetical protein NL676_008492 [Syzygium grande]
MIGQEVGKGVIDEYLRQIGSSVVFSVLSSKLHAYVKQPSAEVSTSGNKKPPRASREAAVSSSQEKSAMTRTNGSKPANQSNSRKKKSGKVVSLAEAAKGSVVFQQAKPVRTKPTGTGSQSGLDQTAPVLAEAKAAAEAYAKRLVVYDWNSAAHEKELLEKKKEEIEEAERAKRSKVVMILDLDGRKVLFNEDEVSEMESRNRKLKLPDERRVFRIKPNPTIRIRPIFIDPSPTKKPDKA